MVQKFVEMRRILLLCLAVAAHASTSSLSQPKWEFDIYNIKTPQLIGIIAGCCVFTITIGVVIYLLIASGTLQNALKEIQHGAANDPSKASSTSNNTMTGVTPFDYQPELYDHLLDARKTLFEQKILLTEKIIGKEITLKNYNEIEDLDLLYEISNGSAQFNESEYHPLELWGFLNLFINGVSYEPYKTKIQLQVFLSELLKYGQIIIIHHNIYKKPIGLIYLNKIIYENLTLNFEYIFIHKSFQKQLIAYESILLLTNHFFQFGFRRITSEFDERNFTAKKLFLKLNFTFEIILKKFKIIQNKNSNISLYSITNSDWDIIKLQIQKFYNKKYEEIFNEKEKIKKL